ncbi:hypothetical protein WA158_003424 [Blastocystis sp. Blastoise]
MNPVRILVPVKRVLDHAVKVRFESPEKYVDLKNMKMVMNPFCEIALEEAIRLKEKKLCSSVVAVSIGPKQCIEQVRQALALGVDKGIVIETNLRIDKDLSSLSVAKILQQIVLKENIDLVLMGKQSIDTDNSQTGSMLSGLLDWPHGSCISKLTVKQDRSLEIVEEVDEGLRSINIQLPAVLTTDLRLNKPRYPTLPNIMKAKKKPIDIQSIDNYASCINSQIEYVTSEEPQMKRQNIMVETVEEFAELLKTKMGKN